MAYAGDSSFGLPANTFSILRHDNNAVGSPTLSILRTNGNVGIGTTSPGAKLDINGTVKSL